MNINAFRIGFTILWLVTGFVLLFRKSLGITYFDERWDEEVLRYAMLIAFALSVRNAFRWWMDRRKAIDAQTPERPNPLRPRENSRPFEYHPELDFTKPSDDAPVRKG
jgi:hypothetical protein